MSETPPGRTGRRRLGDVVFACCVRALFAVPVLLYRAFAAVPVLRPLTQHNLDSQHHYLIAAAAVAVGAPAVGLAAAVSARRRVAAGMMAALLALASGVVLVGAADDRNPRHPTSPYRCQNYGGETWCPQD
jgi:zinc transporter ZupT